MPRPTPSLRLPRLSSQQARQCALFQPFIKRAARGLARAAGPDFDELLSVGYEAVVCALLRFREGVGVLERFVNKTVVLEMVSAVRAYRRLRYREQLLGFASVYDEDTAPGWDGGDAVEPAPMMGAALSGDEIEAFMIEQCTRMLVREAASELPEVERAYFRLAYEQGLTIDEIADQLGATRAKVQRLGDRVRGRLLTRVLGGRPSAKKTLAGTDTKSGLATISI